MNWFEKERLSPAAAELLRLLGKERVVWDTASPSEIEILRRDVARIAGDMDSKTRPPPMFWSGIPWPSPGPEPSCDYQLVISLGGTKTDFAMLRLEKGQVLGLDVLTGKEVSDPEEIDRVKTATQMETPKHGPATPAGEAMISATVRHIARYLKPHGSALERCESILLSWGFPHRVVRTGPRIAGGLSARVTKMTKDQAGFTESLLNKDVGLLFDAALKAELGWSRPIAVANDTVMALHYFLAPERYAGHARVGLFINGTGTNFSAAESYAVGPGGFIASGKDERTPEPLGPDRPLRQGETEGRFFVNYEAGSTELVGTRTRFDIDPDYPIERNALAGGNAFSQQLRLLTEDFISKQAYASLVTRWRAITGQASDVPDARAVSALATGLRDAEIFTGSEPGEGTRERFRLIGRAIVARSALHVALVLSAVTRRTEFGRGSKGAPDLLGMEGSVWKIPGYRDLVKDYWQTLVGGAPLSVDFSAEPKYNASLSGPLYLAAIHRR